MNPPNTISLFSKGLSKTNYQFISEYFQFECRNSSIIIFTNSISFTQHYQKCYYYSTSNFLTTCTSLLTLKTLSIITIRL